MSNQKPHDIEILEKRAEEYAAKYGSKKMNWGTNYLQAHKLGYIQGSLDTQAELIHEREQSKQLADVLAELADLVDDIRSGNYKPDSFTTQPARLILADYQTSAKEAKKDE